MQENSKRDKMVAKYPTLFGKKQLDLEGNIEQTA
jgi:hypothetical protein